MKAMKKAAGATGLTASAAFTKVAETAELKPEAVKVVVTKNGKLGGVLNMKLKTSWAALFGCSWLIVPVSQFNKD